MGRMFSNKAGIIGMKGAIIGSFMFALFEGLDLPAGKSYTVENLIYAIPWIIVVFIVGSILSIGFGYISGQIVEYTIEKLKPKTPILILIGGFLGIICVFLISLLDLFLVLSAHNYWILNHNSAFSVYMYRLGIVEIIAFLIGGLSSYQIYKQKTRI